MTTTLPEVKVREEVRRGAELLDERRPGWDQEINLANLKISSCRNCVLGQLYGDYHLGLDMISSDAGEFVDAEDYGFDGVLDWEELNEEWRDLIASRRV
jgi:hypothetical protein